MLMIRCKSLPKHITIFCMLLVVLSCGQRISYANIPQSEYASDQNTASSLNREYSLIKPFNFLSHWDFTGSTVITSDFIRLTPNTQSNRGAIWSATLVKLRHWEVQVNFKVHGSTGNLFGDGIALWYVDREFTKFDGPIFGVQDKFRGLAILLDTYSNHNGPRSHDHPYVSAMVNNGSFSFDHDRDGTHSQLSGGCTAKFRNRDYDTRLSVRYLDGVLTVSTDVENEDKWKVCFRVANVRLPTHYVFGISAMTGDLSDNHDLIYFKVYELQSKNPSFEDPNEDPRKIIPSAYSTEPDSSHIAEPAQSSWSLLRIFLAVFFGMLALASVVIIGCVYQTRRENYRKRFY